MDERIIKFRVGAMVFAAIFTCATLIVLFGQVPGELVGKYTVYVHFDQAPGVAQDTPVRKNGILIGRVTKVEFADDIPQFAAAGGVIVTTRIDDNVKIRESESCRVNTGLLGDAVLQFMPSGRTSAEVVTDGDYIEGGVATNPLQMLGDLQGDLSEAIKSVSVAGAELATLSGNLNSLLGSNEEQLTRIVGKTEKAIDDFRQTLANVDSIFGDRDVQDNLRQAVAQLPQFLSDTRAAVADVRETVRLAQQNLKNLQGLTGPLGDRGDQLIGNLDSTLSKLDELFAQFGQFGRSLNQGQGTIGQLISNPELYQSLNSAAINVEELTRELRPIIQDARVFVDKIARDPRQLGVKGAVDRSTSGLLK